MTGNLAGAKTKSSGRRGPSLYIPGMPGVVAKLADNEYVEWSTICDAPSSQIVNRHEARMLFGPARVERADTHVTSNEPYRLKSIDQLETCERRWLTDDDS